MKYALLVPEKNPGFVNICIMETGPSLLELLSTVKSLTRIEVCRSNL